MPIKQYHLNKIIRQVTKSPDHGIEMRALTNLLVKSFLSIGDLAPYIDCVTHNKIFFKSKKHK